MPAETWRLLLQTRERDREPAAVSQSFWPLTDTGSSSCWEVRACFSPFHRVWAVLVFRKPAGSERLTRTKGTQTVSWRARQLWRCFGLEALHLAPEELWFQLEMRICRARGKKPQPLKFLYSAVEQGQLISEHLGRWSRETLTSGQVPRFGLSVSVLPVTPCLLA